MWKSSSFPHPTKLIHQIFFFVEDEEEEANIEHKSGKNIKRITKEGYKNFSLIPRNSLLTRKRNGDEMKEEEKSINVRQAEYLVEAEKIKEMEKYRRAGKNFLLKADLQNGNPDAGC